MNEENKSLCLLPFIHFMIKPSGNVKPCCRFDLTLPSASEFRNLNIEKDTPSDILTSTQFQQLRDSMLKGERIESCHKCYTEEEVTGDSMRSMMTQTFSADPDTFDMNVNLRYIEVTFGNYCNLACRTCVSHLSTTWYDDDLELSKIPELNRLAEAQRFNIDFTWVASDFDHVERIKFTGGEPMLHPNFMKFINTILEGNNQSHIELDIYTNASWPPKQRLLEKLSQFKQVTINLSIDGIEKVNDYIRHKSNWHDVIKSTREWLTFDSENDHVETVLCTTFNILNIHNLESLIEWWTAERRNVNLNIHGSNEKRSTTLILLQGPEYMHIKNHPNLRNRIHDLTQYLVTRSYDCEEEKFITERFINRAISTMNKYADEQNDTELFWTYTSALDRLRDESLEKAIPELYDQFKHKQ